MVLFVRLDGNGTLDATLEAEIKRALRERASPRHVPAAIVEVTDIPRTLSGKISERAVSDAVHRREIGNLSALANPEAVEQFRIWAEA
jgi:acetoacetyl-CoA synthetase